MGGAGAGPQRVAERQAEGDCSMTDYATAPVTSLVFGNAGI